MGDLVRRVVVGISGASGSAYGYMALQALRSIGGFQTHLIVTNSARRTIELETDLTVDDFEKLADVVHRDDDLAAAIASGSAAYSAWASEVVAKEKRRLVLVVRETPLHLGHLRTLVQLAEIGATILPPIPAMYTNPQTVDDIVAHTVGKALDQFGIPNELFKRWKTPS